MRKKSFIAVAVSVAALAGLSAGPAFAGEVKGPPGPFVGEPSFTPVRDLNTSICAFSGLNDFIEGEGQTSFHVQSYGIDVSGKGDPADPHEFNPGDACRRGGPAG